MISTEINLLTNLSLLSIVLCGSACTWDCINWRSVGMGVTRTYKKTVKWANIFIKLVVHFCARGSQISIRIVDLMGSKFVYACINFVKKKQAIYNYKHEYIYIFWVNQWIYRNKRTQYKHESFTRIAIPDFLTVIKCVSQWLWTPKLYWRVLWACIFMRRAITQIC